MVSRLQIALLIGVAVCRVASPVSGACPCHDTYCDFDEIATQGRITCYLPGRGPGESALSYTNSEMCTLDDLFARNEVDGPESSGTCPDIDVENVKMEVYLEPCQEIYETYTKNLLQPNSNTKRIRDVVKYIRENNLANAWWGSTQNCTPMTHYVQKAMFTGSSTKNYDSGILVAPASFYASRFLSSSGPFKSNIERQSIQEDGTCTVAIVTMPDISLNLLRMDNTLCVQRVFSNNTEGSLFKNALTNFGPDQLGIIRITSYFKEFLPQNFLLQFINLATWKPYRAQYPGRALISVDSLRNEKFPPDPIDIGTFSRFDAILDEHNVPVIAPFSPSTNVVDGEFTCPDGYCSQAIIPVGGSAPLCERQDGSSCNENITIEANITCPPPSDLYEPQLIVLKGVPLPKCLDRRDIKASGSCPDGQVFDARYQSCTSTKSNRINSRPLDIVLWDFKGKVIFGNNFDSTNGRIITVLVYGDLETTTLGVVKGSGEVFEDYFDKAEKAAFRMPDPGLCLLDGRDFVS